MRCLVQVGVGGQPGFEIGGAVDFALPAAAEEAVDAGVLFRGLRLDDLTEFVKHYGAKGLVWIGVTAGPGADGLYAAEALRSQVTQLEVRKATLGAEAANPAYRVVPPLSFVRTAGAPVDVTLFRLQRTLSLSNDGKPDIYAATLAAEDLAVLGAS
mgnify:CR=1 FL=1